MIALGWTVKEQIQHPDKPTEFDSSYKRGPPHQWLWEVLYVRTQDNPPPSPPIKLSEAGYTTKSFSGVEALVRTEAMQLMKEGDTWEVETFAPHIARSADFLVVHPQRIGLWKPQSRATYLCRSLFFSASILSSISLSLSLSSLSLFSQLTYTMFMLGAALIFQLEMVLLLVFVPWTFVVLDQGQGSVQISDFLWKAEKTIKQKKNHDTFKLACVSTILST